MFQETFEFLKTRKVLFKRALSAMQTLEYGEDDMVSEMVSMFGEMTCEEIGRVFGLTRERIRQIEAVALKKLHRAAARKGLNPCD